MRNTSTRRRTRAPFYLIGALVVFIAAEVTGLLIAPESTRELQPYALGVLAFLLASTMATHSLMEAGERKRILAQRAELDEQQEPGESEQKSGSEDRRVATLVLPVNGERQQ